MEIIKATKKTSLFLFGFVMLLLAACGGAQGPKPVEEMTLDEKKKSLAELRNELKTTELKISQMEKAILSEDPSFSAKKKKKPKVITVVNPEKSDFETFVETTGEVRSIDDIRISAETSGQITELNLRENNYVQNGALIMRVDDVLVRKNISELETQLQLAQTIYEKRKRLWDQNIGSEIEYIQSRTNVESLQKSIETAQTSLDKYSQFSPTSGLIEKLYVNQGEMVGAGSPIADVIDLSKVKVEAELSDAFMTKIKKGDRVEIEVPTLGFKRTTRIKDIGARLNQGSQSFRIEMEVSNPKYTLKPNTLATVKLRDNYVKDAITIPTNLIQQDIRGEYVYVVVDKEGETVAKRIEIVTGETADTRTVVIEGLDGTEVIIDKGYNDVIEGQPLTITEG